jgi:hypothetical protein
MRVGWGRPLVSNSLFLVRDVKAGDISVPDVEAAVAWDLRGMGSVWRKGVREGPAPQEAGKISSQCPTKAGTTWARTRKTN